MFALTEHLPWCEQAFLLCFSSKVGMEGRKLVDLYEMH